MIEKGHCDAIQPFESKQAAEEFLYKVTGSVVANGEETIASRLKSVLRKDCKFYLPEDDSHLPEKHYKEKAYFFIKNSRKLFYKAPGRDKVDLMLTQDEWETYMRTIEWTIEKKGKQGFKDSNLQQELDNKRKVSTLTSLLLPFKDEQGKVCFLKPPGNAASALTRITGYTNPLIEQLDQGTKGSHEITHLSCLSGETIDLSFSGYPLLVYQKKRQGSHISNELEAIFKSSSDASGQLQVGKFIFHLSKQSQLREKISSAYVYIYTRSQLFRYTVKSDSENKQEKYYLNLERKDKLAKPTRVEYQLQEKQKTSSRRSLAHGLIVLLLLLLLPLLVPFLLLLGLLILASLPFFCKGWLDKLATSDKGFGHIIKWFVGHMGSKLFCKLLTTVFRKRQQDQPSAKVEKTTLIIEESNSRYSLDSAAKPTSQGSLPLHHKGGCKETQRVVRIANCTRKYSESIKLNFVAKLSKGGGNKLQRTTHSEERYQETLPARCFRS